jgi:phage baseplate assembly protein W
MSGTRTAAWLFAGLSQAGDDAGSGPVAAITGGIAMAKGDEAVRQSIMLLLSTIPGERVMRPEYGCPLHRIVLSPNDATTAGLAIHYVRQALLRFEKRIDIVRLDAGRSPDGNADSDEARLTIWLQYRIRASQQTGAISLTLDTSQGLA